MSDEWMNEWMNEWICQVLGLVPFCIIYSLSLSFWLLIVLSYVVNILERGQPKKEKFWVTAVVIWRRYEKNLLRTSTGHCPSPDSIESIKFPEKIDPLPDSCLISSECILWASASDSIHVLSFIDGHIYFYEMKKTLKKRHENR